MTDQSHNVREAETEFVTATVAGQVFGMPIAQVRDVFAPERMTRVPLAPRCVAGILNLRGRIVTAIDLRERLAIPPRGANDGAMVIGVDVQGESYGLVVDVVGEVMRLAESRREPVPVNLDADIAGVAESVYRLDNQLMVVLDIARVLDIAPGAIAA